MQEDGIVRCMCLEASSHIDRIPNCCVVLHESSRPKIAHHGCASIYPYPKGEWQALLMRLLVGKDRLLYLPGRANRSQGMIRLPERSIEDRHQPVSLKSCDDSLFLADHWCHDLEVRIQHVDELLRRQTFTQLGKVTNIHKNHRDFLRLSSKLSGI